MVSMEIKRTKPIKYRRFNKKYILVPICVIISYSAICMNMNIDFIGAETLASISATFAGFLITAVSIVFTLNNDFTKTFKKSNLYKDIKVTFFITIVLFVLLTFLFSISVKSNLVNGLFVLGLSETVVLTWYLYEISRESTR